MCGRANALDAAAQAHQETDDCADQKYDEEYFRDAGGADRDSAEAEDGCNQRDDEKDNGIVKHDGLLLIWQCFGHREQAVSCERRGDAVGDHRRRL